MTRSVKGNASRPPSRSNALCLNRRRVGYGNRSTRPKHIVKVRAKGKTLTYKLVAYTVTDFEGNVGLQFVDRKPKSINN